MFPLFFFTLYAASTESNMQTPPAIETADLVEPAAGALRPSSVPMHAVKQVSKDPLPHSLLH